MGNNEQKYRVFVEEFEGCMGHYKKYVYNYYDTYKEAQEAAQELMDSDKSHWTTAYVQEAVVKLIPAHTKTVWKKPVLVLTKDKAKPFKCDELDKDEETIIKAIADAFGNLERTEVKLDDPYLVFDISMFDKVKESGMYQGYKIYFCEHMQPVKVGRFNDKKEFVEEELK